jgi:hypothetical protein
MYLLLSGFTLIQIIILSLIRFPILVLLNHNFPSSGIVLGLKPKKIKIRAPTLTDLFARELTSSVTFPGTPSRLASGSAVPTSRGIPSLSLLPDMEGFWIWGGKIEPVEPLSEFRPLDWDLVTTKK